MRAAPWALALLLSAIGLAALPHADLNEHVFGVAGSPTTLLDLALPHLFGVGLGVLACVAIARLDWARLQSINPWWWLAATTVVVLLPLQLRGMFHYPLDYAGGGVSLTAAMPFLAAWVAALNARLGENQPPLGWGMSLHWIGLVVGLCILTMPLLPFYLVLLLPLLLAYSAPRLRRIGGVSFALLLGALALSVVSAPYRLHRFMAAVWPSWGSDPYGADYQASHVMLILNKLTWFGGDTLIHLPRASSQLLPVSLAEQWGGLAFAGVFVLMGAWLMRVRPHKAGDDVVSEYRHVFSRLLWLSLLLAAVDNACVNLLLLSPHGQGMPLLSGNWGLLVMAWLLMVANGQLPSRLEPAVQETTTENERVPTGSPS